jgi:putative transcriptional regulator
MKNKYYSEASEAIHESARDLYEIGAITEAEMREFDESCLAREDRATPTTIQTQPVSPALAGPHIAL